MVTSLGFTALYILDLEVKKLAARIHKMMQTKQKRRRKKKAPIKAAPVKNQEKNSSEIHKMLIPTIPQFNDKTLWLTTPILAKAEWGI